MSPANPTVRPEDENEVLDRLLERAGPPPEEALALGTWLRRHLPPEVAARAAEQLALRRRAAGRLPRAERLWLTGPGLEQATHPVVAAARAALLAAAAGPGARVLDATCGLGADAAALAAAGCRVVAADRDPRTARCARHDLGVWGAPAPVLVADALAPPVRDPARWLLVVDPSRRPQGRRTLRPSEWSPPWAELAALLPRFLGACVKLAPATRPEELEADLPPDLARHWQWTSRRGELAELCLWTGALAAVAPAGRPGREAQLLARDGTTLARHAGPGPRPADAAPLVDPAAARSIGVPDPALVASGLLGPLAAGAGHAPLGTGLAFTGGDRPARVVGLRDLAVRDTAKLDRKAVRRMLAAHGVGPVRVLARGLDESAAELERRLAGPGSERGLLVAARCDSGRRVWLVDEGRESPSS